MTFFNIFSVQSDTNTSLYVNLAIHDEAANVELNKTEEVPQPEQFSRGASRGVVYSGQ